MRRRRSREACTDRKAVCCYVARAARKPRSPLRSDSSGSWMVFGTRAQAGRSTRSASMPKFLAPHRLSANSRNTRTIQAVHTVGIRSSGLVSLVILDSAASPISVRLTSARGVESGQRRDVGRLRSAPSEYLARRTELLQRCVRWCGRSSWPAAAASSWSAKTSLSPPEWATASHPTKAAGKFPNRSISNSLAKRPSARSVRRKSVDRSKHGGGRGPVAPPVFKTGLAGNTLAGRFDSFPPPPSLIVAKVDRF